MSVGESFSLDGYLARIGWNGSREPTLETLAGVLRAHMTRVPFENLDVLLGRGVRLDLGSVYAKSVLAGRGGYCFEHATLFQAAIEHLGFHPVPHAARVIVLAPKAQAPRTHMFLTVQVSGGAFVLDPGFGRQAPLVPLPLVAGVDARDGGDLHRMVREGEEWVLEAEIDGSMQPLWCSTLEPQHPVDFAVANHFVCTFPESPFVTHLMLQALTPRGRVTVLNRDVTTRGAGGVEKRVLADRAALRALLAADFGFDMPEVERLKVPSVPEWA